MRVFGKAECLQFISKFIFVLKKKFSIGKHTGKLCPWARNRRHGIQIINLCAGKRKQKRRMGGDYKLAAKKTNGIRKKLRKLLLLFRRKTVFRLIKER